MHYYFVMQADWNVVKCSYSAFFFVYKESNVSPSTCAAGVGPRADERALVTRLCVQLLLEREATTPSS